MDPELDEIRAEATSTFTHPGRPDRRIVRTRQLSKSFGIALAVRDANKRYDFEAQHGAVKVLFKDGKPVN